MSILSMLSCAIGHHKPKRRSVRWDGQAFVGECRHCGKDIRRVAHREWRGKPQVRTAQRSQSA